LKVIANVTVGELSPSGGPIDEVEGLTEHKPSESVRIVLVLDPNCALPEAIVIVPPIFPESPAHEMTQ